MENDFAVILMLVREGEERIRRESYCPGRGDRFSSVGSLLSEPWEYVHIGGDCRLLSPHVSAMAAEWGRTTGADMLVFSAPERRMLTRLASGPGECFQMIGTMGRLGLLNVMGNKLFSRRLLKAVPPETSFSRLLFEFLLHLDSLLSFSYPWAEPTAEHSGMSDSDFLLLAQRFATQAREGS